MYKIYCFKFISAETAWKICKILGDIAFRFLDYVNNRKIQDCHVTVCDINNAMLEVGKSRSNKQNYDNELINWKQGDAEDLPFGNDSFNAYTIAFGIRNVTHIDKVVACISNILDFFTFL